MDKRTPAESNAGMRVPPKIKIKALEAVKVREVFAARKVCTSRFATACHRSRCRASPCIDLQRI